MKTDTLAALIRARGLTKEFRQGFFMRRVRAVESVSFEVSGGDIFGFLGPNGAGKTTTIKILTGLIAATGGEAQIFGQSVSSPGARARLGFLPENPYIYPYLTPTEFVELCGRLSGLPGRTVRTRAAEVLARVGMTYASNRPARKLSKGMLQRTGLAAALVADPELLILDEPMSGLDPVGRKEVRDLILDERRKGRTIFFSSHILSDVETLCDKVAILQRGRVVVEGRLDELLRRGSTYRDVVLADASKAQLAVLEARWGNARVVADRAVFTVEGLDRLQSLLQEALSERIAVVEVMSRQETLEDLFLRHDIGRTERA
jgi:ABC-2 type transport system ATP-binding protein